VGHGYAPAVGTLAGCYALSGRGDEADRLMKIGSATPRAGAYFHAILGESDGLFDCLEAAIAERECAIALDVNCHVMSQYRADPRFRAVLRRMNLDPIP